MEKNQTYQFFKLTAKLFMLVVALNRLLFDVNM